jgi:hypothetical protein
MKKNVKLTIVALLFIATITMAQAQEKFPALRMKMDGTISKYGYVDEYNKVVVPFQYDQAKYFVNGMAQVKLKWKWGYIDTTGKEVVPCKYDEIVFSFGEEGLAIARTPTQLVYIDKSGNEVIVLHEAYSFATNFHEGMAIVAKKFDEIQHNYDAAKGKEVSQRYTVAKFGYIDKTGKEVIPCEFRNAGNFDGGLASVSKEIGLLGKTKHGYIDKTNEVVIPFEYDDAVSFADDLAIVKQNKKWGFIDRTGKQVIPCIYEDIGHYGDYGDSRIHISSKFDEGLMSVKQNKKWGFIDKTGKIVIPCKYLGVSKFNNGFSIVLKAREGNEKGKLIRIDKTGNEMPLVPIYEGEDANEN